MYSFKEIYSHYCKIVGVNAHPSRFPTKLPQFFINFLTEEGDIVLDIFSGSNTTGEVAERMNRRWLSFEVNRQYVAASAFRFLEKGNDQVAHRVYSDIMNKEFVSLNEALKLA